MSDKQIPQLAPNVLSTFEIANTRHDAPIPQGVSISDVLVPAFWAHHATKLKPMDEIRVRAEDGTWMANLLVLDSSRTWARVQLLSQHNLGTSDVSLTQAVEENVKAFKAQHEVKYRGAHKWSVLRKVDNAVLHEGMAQRDQAEAWLDNMARNQSAPAAARESVAA